MRAPNPEKSETSWKQVLLTVSAIILVFSTGVIILEDTVSNIRTETAQECSERFGNWSWVEGTNNLTCVDHDTGKTFELRNFQHGATSNPIGLGFNIVFSFIEAVPIWIKIPLFIAFMFLVLRVAPR